MHRLGQPLRAKLLVRGHPGITHRRAASCCRVIRIHTTYPARSQQASKVGRGKDQSPLTGEKLFFWESGPEPGRIHALNERMGMSRVVAGLVLVVCFGAVQPGGADAPMDVKPLGTAVRVGDRENQGLRPHVATPLCPALIRPRERIQPPPSTSPWVSLIRQENFEITEVTSPVSKVPGARKTLARRTDAHRSSVKLTGCRTESRSWICCPSGVMVKRQRSAVGRPASSHQW